MEMSQRVITQCMGYVVDALVSDDVDIFGFALAYFWVCVFVVLLTFDIDCWQFRVEVLHNCPEENVVTIFYIQYNVMQILQLF